MGHQLECADAQSSLRGRLEIAKEAGIDTRLLSELLDAETKHQSTVGDPSGQITGAGPHILLHGASLPVRRFQRLRKKVLAVGEVGP